jgi:hypothetical protein
VRKRAGREVAASSEPDDRKRSIGGVVPIAIRLGRPQATRQAGIARLCGETAIFERGKAREQIRMLKRAGHSAQCDAIG